MTRRFPSTMPLLAATFVLFICATLSALADAEWVTVVVNHEEQLTDGGGMKHKVKVEKILYQASVSPSPLIVHTVVDGSPRVLSYSWGMNQTGAHIGIFAKVTGALPMEEISFNYLFNSPITLDKPAALKNALKGANWMMTYGTETLVGIIGPEIQRSTSGTDERSFAALSSGVLSLPAVVKAIQGSGDGEQTASAMSAIKILGGLFGGGIGGGVRCAKKKVTTLKCTAQCAMTPEGCPCTCMGMACCSACESSEQTVWEYSGGVNM